VLPVVVEFLRAYPDIDQMACQALPFRARKDSATARRLDATAAV
jgi:hypothetical protein